jgi:hypothetical protein
MFFEKSAGLALGIQISSLKRYKSINAFKQELKALQKSVKSISTFCAHLCLNVTQ